MEDPRVSKAGYTVAGLIFAKPLVILAVGLALGIANEHLSPAAWSGGGFGVLAALTLTAIAVLFCGIAPFALLKWAPVLPTDAGSHDRSSAGLMTGAVIGGAGSMLAQAAANGRDRLHRAAVPLAAAPAAQSGGAAPAGERVRAAGSVAGGGGRRATRRRRERRPAGPTAPDRQARPTTSRWSALGHRAAGRRGAGRSPSTAASRTPTGQQGDSAAAATSATRRQRCGGAGGAGVSAAAAISQAALNKARHTAQHQTPEADEPGEQS